MVYMMQLPCQRQLFKKFLLKTITYKKITQRQRKSAAAAARQQRFGPPHLVQQSDRCTIDCRVFCRVAPPGCGSINIDAAAQMLPRGLARGYCRVD
jgi:hypothetical protein